MKALLPGSYDPCTLGHLSVIERAAARFDSITVAVCINPEKRGLFSYADRVEFLRLATEHLKNASVIFFDGMVADYAKEHAFDKIVKGVRSREDLAYEQEMAAYNLARGGVATELLQAEDGLFAVSSSAVREALSLGKDIASMVPKAAHDAILASYKGTVNGEGSAVREACRAHEGALREDYLSREELFTGHIAHLVRDTVRLPGGATATREVILHNGAVAVVPLFEDGTVLMEYQYRYPHGRVVYEIPAGKLDRNGEGPRAAALRELREETGYTAARLTSLGRYVPSPALLGEVIELYLAEGLTPGECEPDEGELVEVERRPLEELCLMALSGEIEDGKTVTALLRALHMKKGGLL